MHHYFAIYKPEGMVSQFVSPHREALLGELRPEWPEGTHAIGRLDRSSEGLLLLTTNKAITRLLFQDKIPHTRTYLVRARGRVTPEGLERLRNGVLISGFGGHAVRTKPCAVEVVTDPEAIVPGLDPHRSPGPHTWLLMHLTEGKFHQVRKMLSAIGNPSRRLIRVSIENLTLDGMKPGEVRELSEEDFFTRLKLPR